MERTFFFTIEFTFKAGYAELIGWAAKASYEEPVTNIYLLASTTDSLQNLLNLKIIYEQGDKKIIGITRWGAFTKGILQLAEKNIDLIEIGGNDEIVVSVLMKKNPKTIFTYGDLLYESRVVSNPDLKRNVYLLPVSKLLPFINEAKGQSCEIEHVFDY